MVYKCSSQPETTWAEAKHFIGNLWQHPCTWQKQAFQDPLSTVIMGHNKPLYSSPLPSLALISFWGERLFKMQMLLYNPLFLKNSSHDWWRMHVFLFEFCALTLILKSKGVFLGKAHYLGVAETSTLFYWQAQLPSGFVVYLVSDRFKWTHLLY